MGIGFAIIARDEHAGAILELVPEARRIGEIISRSTSDEAAVQGLSC